MVVQMGRNIILCLCILLNIPTLNALIHPEPTPVHDSKEIEAHNEREGRQMPPAWTCIYCDPMYIPGMPLCCGACYLNVTQFGRSGEMPPVSRQGRQGTASGSQCTGCTPVNTTPLAYSCQQCPTACTPLNPPPPVTPGIVTIYRFTYPGVSDHWYSTNASANLGTNYTQEPSLCKAYAGTASGVMPIFEYSRAGYARHFYTTDVILGNSTLFYGYTYTGIVASIYSNLAQGVANLVPIWWYENYESGYVLLTTNQSEAGDQMFWQGQAMLGMGISL